MKLQKDCGKSQTNSGNAKDVQTMGPDTLENYANTFPELKTVSAKQLSCCKKVLIRTKEEGVGLEDLDKLQLELEILLSAVAVRIQKLNSEITALSIAEEKKDKRGKLASTPTETAVTSSGNIIIKEEISIEDTGEEQQKSEQDNNCITDSVKLETSDDFLQELVPYWPVTDSVKIETHVSLDQNEVKIESELGLCAGKNIISERCTKMYKNDLLSDDNQIANENFSKYYMHGIVENNILPWASEYNNSDKNGQCRKCNASNKCKCRKQNAAVHYTKTQSHVCNVCNRSFSKRYRLERHKLIHDEVKNFSCDVCSKSFTHTYSLFRHKLIHRDDNKSYCCDVCNRAFRDPCSLVQHKLIHSEVKNYHCNICDKAFRQKWDLSKHKVVHNRLVTQHVDNISKRYSCELCNKMFDRANTLTRHKLSHSGIKKYRCDICGKLFSRSYTLSNHKLIHTDVNINQCDICNKIFSMPNSVKQHKLIIHSECKRYQCSDCNKGFVSKRDLQRHVLIHMMVDSNNDLH